MKFFAVIHCLAGLLSISSAGCSDIVATEEPLGPAKSGPVVTSETTSVTNEDTDPQPQSTTDEEEVVQEGDSNTAGGIGQAKVKEKSTVEELVPEEARKLTEAVMKKIPPVLRGLRDSGRLNWKMGELEDDVLVLKWKQEQFLLSLCEKLEDYLSNIEFVRGKVFDRIVPVGGQWLYQESKDRIAEGKFVHPEFRRATKAENFGQVPGPLSPFLEVDVLFDTRNNGRHPMSKLRNRIAQEDVRRSDLFYLLMAYRIATDDYARILDEEGEFDRVVGIPKFTELCPEGERYLGLRYQNVFREEVEYTSRGHFYLPRLHQAEFEKSYGPHWPRRKTPKEIEFEELSLLMSGVRPPPEPAADPGNPAAGLFREPLPRGPAMEFLTTVQTPKNRDSLKKQRDSLDEQMKTLVELLGEEWAEFDFEVRPISGEDTYFSQRVLMEELEDRIRPKERALFGELVSKMTSNKSKSAIVEIADEYLPPDEAEELATFVIGTDGNELQKPILDENKEYAVSDLNAGLQRFYLSVVASVRGEYFDEPVPEEVSEACRLISEGEHLAVEGKKAEALEKFKAAMKSTKLSKSRCLHLAEFCKSNGFADDAATFWSEPVQP